MLMNDTTMIVIVIIDYRKLNNYIHNKVYACMKVPNMYATNQGDYIIHNTLKIKQSKQRHTTTNLIVKNKKIIDTRQI